MTTLYGEVKEMIQSLPDQEATGLLNWLATYELPRREDVAKEESAKAALMLELQNSGVVQAPAAVPEGDQLPDNLEEVPEWENPGTDHTKMYRKGDRVRYNGKLVVSTHDWLNSWEPGTLGFDGRIWSVVEVDEPGNEEIPVDTPEPAEPTIPEFVQPTATTAYSKGNKVLYQGKTYVSLIDNNVWSPEAYPAGWSVKEV